MLHFQFHHLQRVGLTPALAARAGDIAATSDTTLELLRVCALHRETLALHDGESAMPGRVAPRLARSFADGADALAVGDWVLAQRDASGTRWVSRRVPPSSHIARRDADGSRHAVVSNVDHALLVMGLDDDFNLRRLERYLALAQASGVEPTVVLTKDDIAAAESGTRAARLDELEARISAGVEVIVIDATDPASARHFAHLTRSGRTLVLLGSSGAGKSTLTNTLLGAAVQDTGAVRANDSRGMHTTTGRSLHLLPGGGCVIDTPGLRTLRPDIDEATLSATFGDIGRLASQCRFRDCGHADEPGCAVRAGVDPDRLRNFQKLLRETQRDAMTWVERRQQRAAWKSRGKAAEERMRLKRGGA